MTSTPLPYMEPAQTSPGTNKIVYNAPKKNSGTILEKLRGFLVPDGETAVLEVGSGSGQHAAFFTTELPLVQWQPTDLTVDAFESIREYARDAGPSVQARIRDPVAVDAASLLGFHAQLGHSQKYDIVLAINVVHIAPWSATVGLIRGAAEVLRPTGVLLLYGPFAVDGVLEPQSNVDFDRSLKERCAAWGVRDTANIAAEAAQFGLKLKLHPTSNNNYVLELSHLLREPQLLL